MNPYVCIVVSDILLQDLLVKRYEAAPVEGGEGIFAGKISSEEETPLVIVSISSPEKRDEVLRQVFDNYQIQKVVLTSLVSTPHLDGDLKVGDVIIPNTYIDAN
ncbi:MAG: hypothetical protein H6767_02155 [Candidatus Peribacteria bacterium]|nr:MAG: hypothetical protein H6767_02155 [Candidatus Peribacteria bacterium]